MGGEDPNGDARSGAGGTGGPASAGVDRRAAHAGFQGTDPDPEALVATEAGLGPRTDSSGALGVGRGALIGRYVVLRELGRGAMGTVFEAFDPQLERKVALKVLRGEHRNEAASRQSEARMLREAQAMAKLSHPNVITVFDVGTTDHGVFLAMEVIDGMTLKAWLEGEHTLAERLRIMTAAGEGLAAAHDAGVVHRDFKPDNVLVAKDGRVVVLDFGLATAAVVDDVRESPSEESGASIPDLDALATPESSTANLTRTGAIMGTPAYMAPEQHEGAPVDARTDQFAFCVSVYEAVTGVRPFAGETIAALTFAVMQGNIREAPDRSVLPVPLERALRKGLATRPADRHDSMRALLDVLQSDPGRARRRRLLVGAGVGLLAFTLGGYSVQERARVSACEQRDGLGGAWSEAQRESARARFTENTQIGADMFRRIDQVLSDYRSAWQRLDSNACIEPLDEPVESLRALCLQDARARFETLAELMTHTTPEWVPNAIVAVEGLPVLDDCGEVEQLSARFPEPPPASSRELVAEARLRLAEAGALRDAQHHEEAQAAIDRLARDVEEIGNPPLSAEFSLERARIGTDVGNYDAAETELWTAISLGRAAHHTAVEGEAWCHLVFLVGRSLARPDDALRWIDVARAAVDAADLRFLDALLAANTGAVYFQRGDFAVAREYFITALDTNVELRGPESLRNVPYLNNVGTIFAAEKRFADARPYFQRALELRRDSYGDEHPEVALVLHNLGILAMQEGDLGEAERLLQRALAVRTAALSPKHPDTAKTLAILGGLKHEQEDHEASVEYLRRALKIRRQIHRPSHPEVTTVEHGLGLELGEIGAVDEGRQMLAHAIESRIAEHGPTHEKLGGTYENLAKLEAFAGNFEGAAEAMAKAVVILQANDADPEALREARDQQRRWAQRLAPN